MVSVQTNIIHSNILVDIFEKKINISSAGSFTLLRTDSNPPSFRRICIY